MWINCTVLLLIDYVRVKSLNFFSGKNFENACEAKERCSHSCGANYIGFNCNFPQDDQCRLNCNGQICMQTCDGRRCDLECNGPQCKQTCNNAQGVCSLKCNGENCVQICNQGNCGLECTGGKCTHICYNNGGQCTLTCKGENCVQTCDGGGCSLQCNGNFCEQTCRAEDTCSLECLRGNCNQKCNQQCNLECRGERCTQDCSEVLDSCQLQCPVVIDPTKRCQQDCPRYKRTYCTTKYISTTKAPTVFSEPHHSCTGE